MMHSIRTEASLADLTWLNTADMLRGFGLASWAARSGPLALACRRPAQRFARDLLHLDGLVAAEGLPAAGAWMLRRLNADLRTEGPELPPAGPLLIVANHPGLLDAMALFASIPRADLRVLAIARPFLRAMPHIAARLIAVGDHPAARTAATRAAARHLRQGGALLTFPAGRIEPDPLRLPGALDSLAGWSQSIDALARLGGGATVVPLIVGGVLAPAALSSPLLRLRRSPEDRQWLAAILQLLVPALQRTTVRVARGRPIGAADPAPGAEAVAEARRLIEGMARL